MTYTLFECIKEQLTELLDELEVELKNAAVNVAAEDIKKIHIAPVINTGADTQPGVKKEQLTKSQKRRMWERTDNKGQKPRGWDWVKNCLKLDFKINKNDFDCRLISSDTCPSLAIKMMFLNQLN